MILKKLVIGVVIGFVLSLPLTANGAVQSLIGKVVDGEFTVTVNKSLLPNKAIVIEGTSYLPVRTLSDATGYNVYFEANKGIDLVDKKLDVQEKLNSIDKGTTELPVKLPNGEISNAKSKYFVVDGNVYLYLMSLASYIKDPSYNDLEHELTFTVPDKGQLKLKLYADYSPGADGLVSSNGGTYLKISTLDLKATVQDGYIVIEKK
jgi:hypothetical protein